MTRCRYCGKPVTHDPVVGWRHVGSGSIWCDQSADQRAKPAREDS